MEAQVAELILNVRYDKKAKDKDAPSFCNCITSIRYLFEKTTKVSIPHQWIGNLPKELLLKKWKIVELKLEDLQAGDLIFFKNHTYIRKITHLAVVISPNCFFHCTSRIGGCEVAKCEALHERYEIVSDREILLNYQDPRGELEEPLAKTDSF